MYCTARYRIPHAGEKTDSLKAANAATGKRQGKAEAARILVTTGSAHTWHRQQGGHRPVQKTRARLTIALVAAGAGLLFASNAQLARTSSDHARVPQDLVAMVRSESQRVESLTATMNTLTDQIDELAATALPQGAPDGTWGGPQDSTGSGPGGRQPPVTGVDGPDSNGTDGNGANGANGIDSSGMTLSDIEAISVGSQAVQGAGIRIILEDAPASSQALTSNVDDLVIHQQDLQNVINSLWAGGAEALTLMGERVTMTSAFRCVGNVLLLHGQVFSPPFVVEAIGDPVALRHSVMANPGVQVFLDYVTWLGLGFEMEDIDFVVMPAYTGTRSLLFASLPEEGAGT